MSTIRIAIIGASFAGLRAYISLKKRFPQATFYLFDQEEYFTFIPSFHLSLCKPKHLRKSQLSLKKYFGEAFIREEVLELNKDHIITKNKRYFFDYAIVAVGAKVNYYGNKSLEKFGLGAKSLSHMRVLHKKLPDAKKVAIIGAGLSGVEYAAMLASTTDKEITLINSTNRVVPNLSASASLYAHKYMEKKGVKIYNNTKAVSANKTQLALDNGEVISADLIMQCTGLDQSCSLVDGTQLNDDNSHKENENIFFCGDVARTNKVPTAHSAMIEGDIVASSVAARIRGTKFLPRKLKHQTTLAVGLGHYDGFIAFKNWHLPLPFLTGFLKLHIEKSILYSFRWRIRLYI